jgi:hypothetical protein
MTISGFMVQTAFGTGQQLLRLSAQRGRCDDEGGRVLSGSGRRLSGIHEGPAQDFDRVVKELEREAGWELTCSPSQA